MITAPTTDLADAPRSLNEPKEHLPGLDNARTGLTLLVVAQHAALAYAASAAPGAFRPSPPVVDSDGSVLMLNFVTANDSFMMPLMFLISGLCVPGSLARYSGVEFLSKRRLRLGIPFIVMMFLIVPAALFIAESNLGERDGFVHYWMRLFSQPTFPVGPGWFLSLLLLFDRVAAHPRVLGSARARTDAARIGHRLDRPSRFILVVLAASILTYAGPLLWFGPDAWIGAGPLVCQGSRVLLYALYFGLGTLLGAGETRLGGRGGVLVAWGRSSFPSIPLAVAACILLLWSAGVGLSVYGWPAATLVRGGALVLFSAAMSTVILIQTCRIPTQTSSFLSHLNTNAFGIYVVHYLPVLAIQKALRDAALSSDVKAGLVFCISLAFSWWLVAMLRRISAVRKVL